MPTRGDAHLTHQSPVAQPNHRTSMLLERRRYIGAPWLLLGFVRCIGGQLALSIVSTLPDFPLFFKINSCQRNAGRGQSLF